MKNKNNEIKNKKTGMKNKKPGTKNSRQEKMWDLLIPLFLVLCVMPLIVHLAVYSCGYSQYNWYANEDLRADFYCYYKSYFLDVTAIFTVIILVFRMTLYREKTRSCRQFLPLFVYVAFVILSTIASVNRPASLQGNFESFESTIVLISYVVIAFYAYQILEEERDYRLIFRGIVVITAVFCVTGILQAAGLDLMQYAPVQKLMMSAEDYAVYGGEIKDTFSAGRVYLTLYNPDYAGIVLSMLYAVFLVMFFTEKEQGKRLCYGIVCVVLGILVWFTYTRTSLLTMLLVTAIVFFWQKPFGKQKYVSWKYPAMVAVAVILLMIASDASHGWRYLDRILEQNNREPLTAMTTESDGIYLTYDGTEYRIYRDKDQVVCENRQDGSRTVSEGGKDLILPMEDGAEAMISGEDKIMLYLADTTLTFIQDDSGYLYETSDGKTDRMQKVAAADLHGMEYLGSARGYIWSRTLPLLKYYLLAGSGPDTFAEVFPQNDYAGKIVYADDPARIIEKAHNDYLTKWVQTGFISMASILVFYGIILVKGKRGCELLAEDHSMKKRLGVGCYLACISYMAANLFNDSTLQTTPLFFVFAGIVLSMSADSL